MIHRTDPLRSGRLADDDLFVLGYQHINERTVRGQRGRDGRDISIGHALRDLHNVLKCNQFSATSLALARVLLVASWP